jgi:hypothetical protein
VYVGVLLSIHLVVDHALSARQAATTLRYLSTNLDNLRHHPIPSLLGSALIIDSALTHLFTLDFTGTLITLVLGIAITLAALERRLGAARAYAVLAAGHIGATLLVAPVIVLSIAHGWYPANLRDTRDVGISYGAQAVLGCATVTLLQGRLARIAWAVFVVGWPLFGLEWMVRLPDFTTLGHLTAAGIGFAAGLCLRSRRRRGSSPPSVATDGGTPA